MIKLTEVTNDYIQKLEPVLDTGETFELKLQFIEQQRQWWFSITYQDFTVINSTLTASPNILRKYKNIIPFGISCISTDQGDPYFKDDFSSGRIALYALNKSEVQFVETDVIGL